MNIKLIIIIALTSALTSIDLSRADEVILPMTQAPSSLDEGTQQNLTQAQIDEILPWAKNSKVFLNDILDNLHLLGADDKIDRLTNGIKHVIQESGSKSSETFMRYSLNRALVINEILKKEMTSTAIGTLDVQIRLLEHSIKMSIRYYDTDMDIINKKISAPYALYGIDYFNFLNELNKSIFDASAQYCIERTALAFLQWDLYRDLNNKAFAPQIVKINNSLKLLPIDKKLEDSQSLAYVRQMKSISKQLKIYDSLSELDKSILLKRSNDENALKESLKQQQQDQISQAESEKSRKNHTPQIPSFSKGTEVLLTNSSNEYRVGNIDTVFSDGKIKIIYNYNGRTEVFRRADEISPSVECTKGICSGDNVYLLNGSNEARYGKTLKAFANGIVFISYNFSGKTEVYRSASNVSKEIKCIKNICTKAKVHLFNDSGEDRDGTVLSVFENGMAQVYYEYSGGSNKVWRNVSFLSTAL